MHIILYVLLSTHKVLRGDAWRTKSSTCSSTCHKVTHCHKVLYLFLYLSLKLRRGAHRDCRCRRCPTVTPTCEPPNKDPLGPHNLNMLASQRMRQASWKKNTPWKLTNSMGLNVSAHYALQQISLSFPISERSERSERGKPCERSHAAKRSEPKVIKYENNMRICNNM